MNKFLLGVGVLGALVSLAKQGAQDGELHSVVEDSAEGNSRRLDRGKVVERHCEIKKNDLTSGPSFPALLNVVKQSIAASSI